MGKFIKVIKTGIDVSKVTEQLRKNPADWNHQKTEEGVSSLVDEHGFDDLPISNLQLTIGAVKKREDFVGDSELNVNTPAYKRHTEIFKLIKEEFGDKDIHRCGFLALPVDEYVGAHIDEGTYYKTKDRYHLSIKGEYQYFTGRDSIIVKPGTLFWFDNKQPHGAVNTAEETRITFVFDVSHSPTNPQHNIEDGER